MIAIAERTPVPPGRRPPAPANARPARSTPPVHGPASPLAAPRAGTGGHPPGGSPRPAADGPRTGGSGASAGPTRRPQWNWPAKSLRPRGQCDARFEDIVGQARGKDFSANFTWKLVADKSVDGELWEQFATAIVPTQSATGQVVGAAHSTRSDYANNLRFAIGVANASGSATEIGNVTAFAAIKFWS